MAYAISPLPTYDPNLTLEVSSGAGAFTPRQAVDTSGRFGMLYDASRDKILHNSRLDLRVKHAQSRRKPTCYVEKYESQIQNLLKWYNIYVELRLSVALEIVQTGSGVGALNTYSRVIDKCTRFIVYKYYSHTEYLSDADFERRNRIPPPPVDSDATHVTVLVNWGVTAVAVLQLVPDDKNVARVDTIIKKLCYNLEDNYESPELTDDELSCLKSIRHTQVFSNIEQLSKISSIVELYQVIRRVKSNIVIHQPCNYNFCSLQHFFQSKFVGRFVFREVEPYCRDKIEDYLIHLSRRFRLLSSKINQDYPNVHQTRKNQLATVRSRYDEAKESYKSLIHQLQRSVVGVRRGEFSYHKIDEILFGNQNKEVRTMMDLCTSSLSALEEKEKFISNLVASQFTYRDATEFDIDRNDDKQSIESKLKLGFRNERAICSNDDLYRQQDSKWSELCKKLYEERKQKPSLKLIYVDFSDCPYKLQDFLIFPEQSLNSTNDQSSASRRESTSERLQSDGIKNILLIGESGVGKSTFINALVNYLRFDSLQEAQENPVALMPVSFILAVGDDFTEKLITFHGQETISTEDFSGVGQSVTQYCKSYLVTIPDHGNKENTIRIIDTPGIGDVRGVDKDDANLQHILSFISNLQHLDAICILMKPNTSRMNVSFRSCFTQLYAFLGEDAREKFLFCFTNTRSTFYTPGDTARVLKQFLAFLPGKQAPFTKQNTFCFDSESFRYLMAIQNDIQFHTDQQRECNESWSRSTTEARRLLNYINNNMLAPLVPSRIQSVHHAQLKITRMVRPILETIRNTLRNIILRSYQSNEKSIKLVPNEVTARAAICSTCRLHTDQIVHIGEFYIIRDSLHVFSNSCQTCKCSPDEHYPVDYNLGYELSSNGDENSRAQTMTDMEELCSVSSELEWFLVHSNSSSLKNPFLRGFEKMIEEEAYICSKNTPNDLNRKLRNKLEKLKKIFEEKKDELMKENRQIMFPEIYNKLENIEKIEMIHLQMAVMKQPEKGMPPFYEYQTPF
ncbi:unnamed protein product [Adineta ricciae]|uniref:G domain-containing protein n=1 Tax=Adineta ricciae TaxID=249248 RepID=A0A813TKE6_ADIRI|nr:unnamed protein product [Adineta ricciae]CAF0990852.1 unnamed protein product [Adineta ricciae]